MSPLGRAGPRAAPRFPGPGATLSEPAVHQQRPLAHARNPRRIARQFRGHPLAIVDHAEGHALRVCGQRHGRRTGLGVAQGVGEALLGDAVHDELDI